MFVLAGFLVSPSAQAWDYRLGFQAGLASSSLNYDPDIPTDWYKAGFWGFTNEFRLSEEGHFSLVADLNLVQKGTVFFETNQDKVDRYRYIEVPVLIRYGFGSNSMRFYFELGPSAALQLSATQTTVLSSGLAQAEIRPARRFEFSIQAGAGVEQWFREDIAIFLGARHVRGVTDASGSDSTYSKSKFSTWEFFTGPKIKL